MKKYLYDVFVSHSPSDQKWMDSVLLPQLASHQIKAFVPYRDMALGVYKIEEIEQAIQSSSKTLLIITPEYLKDSWANLENMLAQFIDPASRERRSIQLIVEPCELPLHLRAVTALDLTSPNIPESSWQKLFDAIKPEISEKQVAATYSPLQNITTLDDAVNEIKNLVTATKYEEAQTQAEQCFNVVVQHGDPILLGKLEVWYAHAIMYLGKTNEAKAVLGSVISKCEMLNLAGTQMAKVNYILGRAHNNLGYLLWVDLGQYRNALDEFYKAIRYFLLCNQIDDVATVCDNLGRVYAQLGYGIHAELLIEHGKTIRQDASDNYRLALSLDSLANAYLASGQPNRALNLSQQALHLFTKFYEENKKGERGIGLALLTKGRSERLLGSLTYTGDDKTREYKSNLDQLSNAEKTLVSAERYFKQVKENIRLFQVYNELACVYRELIEISKRLRKGDEFLEQLSKAEAAIKESLRYIEHDDVSGNIKYRLHYIDACEDMARTLNIANLPNPEKEQDPAQWINEAIKQIPLEYQFAFTAGSEARSKIRTEQMADEFWQQMGKIYALIGETLFEKDVFKAVEYFILATACFGIFRERKPSLPSNEIEISHIRPFPTYTPQLASHRVFMSKLYGDLKQLKGSELQNINDILVPKVVSTYSLQDSWLYDFSEVLQILLRVKVASATIT